MTNTSANVDEERGFWAEIMAQFLLEWKTVQPGLRAFVFFHHKHIEVVLFLGVFRKPFVRMQIGVMARLECTICTVGRVLIFGSSQKLGKFLPRRHTCVEAWFMSNSFKTLNSAGDLVYQCMRPPSTKSIVRFLVTFEATKLSSPTSPTIPYAARYWRIRPAHKSQISHSQTHFAFLSLYAGQS